MIIKNKRSQLTIFIIIAIIIVAGIGVYFLIRDSILLQVLPAKFQPIENYYLDCIKITLEDGKNVMSDRGGWIYPPEFEPGSDFSPFSSQLDFNGIGVPYWYYASGNNVIKEQVPSRIGMQEQLQRYGEDNLACDFSDFEAQGYAINTSGATADVTINDADISIRVNSEFIMAIENETARQTVHRTILNSKLGKFYSKSLEIYNYEKQNMFLENYALDILRLYAPVDGVEIACSPKVWMKSDIDAQLKNAIEANTQAIKLTGNYYTLANPDNKYFVQDIQTDEAVNFLYSSSWPTRIEIWDSNNGVLVAKPVGNQAGLGAMGFCYVPYHFVYDLDYPVLIQIYDGLETFQFPVAVILSKNKQRNAIPATIEYAKPELCKYPNQNVLVHTYNNRLEPVEANLNFECLGEVCDMGRTKTEENDAILDVNVPSCINGFISATASGYTEKKQQVSTNAGSSVDIILDRIYNLSVDFKLDGEKSDEQALIYFSSEGNSQTIAWPEQKMLQISEGDYNVSVYVYRNSSIILPAVDKEYCSEVPRGGLAGFLGGTTEKCFNVKLPAQTISNSIAGGGKGQEYLTEDMLEKGKIEINVNSLPAPANIEGLQDNYNLIEVSPVYVTTQ